jgi:[glutamine synthetase] adenylyltransferase / [glutamine synthetase]-adenylyl-L-tyrosine phosphorylase
MLRLLKNLVFQDTAKAHALATKLAAQLPQAIQDRLVLLMSSSPDPDQSLLNLGRLFEQHPRAFQRLILSPMTLQMLVAVFSHSQFLSEEILKAPEWIEEISEADDLHRVLSADEYLERLEGVLSPIGPEVPPPLELARFRRRQLLRILVRDVLGYGTVSDVTEEISNLADAIIDSAYFRIRHQLAGRFGEPADSTFSVLSLGKLGGRELNYSSDIDLMFLYSKNGETDGREPISNKEFFKKLCTQLTELLSSYTPYGHCYRVDLRLRPEGTLGEVCISLDGARAYYQVRARDWELQMLIKARVSAGDRALGRSLLEFVEPLTYTTTTDFSAIEAVSVARERISEKAAKRRGTRTGFDIKLAPGGIRDIEFLVQCLQRLHGGREPFVRHGGTLLALFRLHNKALLSDVEYSRLASAYQFLRHLEHRLQLENDLQTHTLPEDDAELERIARRMPAVQAGNIPSAAALRAYLDGHLASVREIYERVIHAQLPAHYRDPVRAPNPLEEEPAQPTAEAQPPDSQPSNLVRSLELKAPSLGTTIARHKLTHGRKNFEHFLERILPNNEFLNWLDDDPVLAGYVIDFFEHSPFFAEQLIRKPELLHVIHDMRARPHRRTRFAEMADQLVDPTDLRRFFRREMLRLQAKSICLHRPIFDTLRQTSELADCVIAGAYRMAVEETIASNPPQNSAYTPFRQMMVIALGRLGMIEFDVASDADLVFVLPDEDARETVFWTRVANRTIDIITAYTGEGVIFAIDTRLRPNGREGPLVQTVSTYKDYFEKSAEAWEGITYMKSRGIAGDLEQATQFLNELQDVDFRRYGQGGRSKSKLRQMRKRLEEEQGVSNPLKAGYGGYYDIDFALMFLRLKGAGIFFKVLNTPERIDVIEKMGHLDRADANFLRDAATFYRSLDHGIRLSSGHAEGNLPNAPLQLQILAELVSRWVPDHLHDQPLPIELEQIQQRTRDYFDRLFGA